MCQTCMSRRRFLITGAAATTVSGCDGPPDLVSDAEVERLGLQGWEQIRETSRASDNAEMQEALIHIAGRLLGAAGQSPEGWEFVVFEGDEANAFALPGGKVGVYEGMFGVAETMDQLAAVVGHEIGHLAADHSHKRINAQVAKQYSIRFLAFLLNAGDVEYADTIAAALGLGVEFGLLLPYSRDQEIEADAYGVRLMPGAGFDPRQALAFWERMEQVSNRRAPEFLATHPAPESRIEALKELLTEMT